MKKVLIILPKSIAGALIMKGFAYGFEVNKCRVLTKELDKLIIEDIDNFSPDVIFGYDYSFLMDENCTKIIQNCRCKNLVFYFADEPKSHFALGKQKDLYEKLDKIKKKVFIWDKDFLNEFKNSFYLPLAINPNKYLTDFNEYKYTISFVGRPLGDIRQNLLCEVVKSFGVGLNIFCYEKHFKESIKQIIEKKLLDDEDIEIYSKCWKGFAEKEEELAEIYNSSKINLNITLQGKSSINYRVFEVLTAGGFLLTDEREDLKKYFKISKHLESYKNSQDLIDKISFYLKNLNVAQRIAELGRLETVKTHSFSARAKIILKQL